MVYNPTSDSPLIPYHHQPVEEVGHLLPAFLGGKFYGGKKRVTEINKTSDK